MAGFRDFLMRFRPVGSPGRAAPVGVPADRSAELTAELEPPLALLEEAEAQARSIRAEAARTVARQKRDAEHRAARIVREAHVRSRDVRTQSADRVRREAEAEAAELIAAADRQTAATRRRARARMPAAVDRVLELVVDELAGPGGSEATSTEATPSVPCPPRRQRLTPGSGEDHPPAAEDGPR